jgi:oligopeptide transport system ATP-binding protein
MRPLRQDIQVIFQDPYGSLNPRRRVGSIIGDPFVIHGIGSAAERKRTVQELMERVGLNPEHYNRFPAEFSGGQRQRIGVARALALRPKLIVADEPVSALDVSIQAQMINLLEDLQDEFKLTYVFIAHDLGVVRHVSDRIAVMYLGKLVELSPAEELYTRPIMPYTEALLSAVPIPDPDLSEKRKRIVLQGDVPSPINPPSGCRFHPRCRYATEICSKVEPPLVDYGNGHLAACHHPLNVDEETLRRVRPAPETPLAADNSALPVDSSGESHPVANP